MDEFGIHKNRLENLRDLMRDNGWDAVVIPGSDPHCSEYMALRWHQIEWLTGYTGEGDMVVTLDHAGLWTDPRYFIQAREQLEDTGTVMHETRVPNAVGIPQWLAQTLCGGRIASEGSGEEEESGPVTIAVDGECTSIGMVDDIRKAVGEKGIITNAPSFLDELWSDRPRVPQTPVQTLGAEQTGWSRIQKIEWIRNTLRAKKCDAILLTALDEIAWMLNVRGTDIDYNPVVMSYLLVTQEEVNWYVQKGASQDLDSETADSFYEMRADGVNILDYGEITISLASMMEDGTIKALYMDPSTLNYNLYTVMKENSANTMILGGKSPVALRKAVKNSVEIAGMKEAHLEDGVAMEKFLYWLEKSVQNGETVSEWDAAVALGQLRAEIPGYRGDSFETVSAFGKAAALPHYSTPTDGSTVIYPKGLYLNDSGGQYIFGTTDITRTVPLGPCTEEEKIDYTLVLKAHIGLATAVFPRGTAGCQIDSLARIALWKEYRDFRHGTGHGVGFYLNVHEGPQGIRQDFNRQPILPGMITSNEPGIYREGKHGVRHENLVLCVEAEKNEFGDFLKFETLTLCHFDTSIVVKKLMSPEEIEWLNAYNERVYETLKDRLTPEEASWLKTKTRAL
ncbi:MAG: aminopeptidase P family protein [Bacteroidales bacterium]|nr:aminopeptidase P family protein [Bacteroidales bacterium]